MVCDEPIRIQSDSAAGSAAGGDWPVVPPPGGEEA